MSFIVAPLVSTPLNTSFSGSFANTDWDNVDSVANYTWGGVDQGTIAADAMTTGAETYVITSGAVASLTGISAIDGVTIAVGSVVFIPTAPASSGTGTAISSGVGSSSAANGVYVCTGTSGGNIQLARHTTMSTVAANKGPIARVIFVRIGGTANGFTMWSVKSPTTYTGFSYGSTAIQFQNYLYSIKNVLLVTPTIQSPVFSGTGVANAAIQQAGICNFNTSLQSQLTAASTKYYIAGSALQMPASPLNGMVANKTTFIWNVMLTKDANGTGTIELIIFRGTNGTSADTVDVSPTLGTMTAVIDEMIVNVQLTVTTTGASGGYYWSINPDNRASVPATAAGFGIPGTGSNAYFNGTIASVAMNTTSLIFGLGFVCTAGGTMPTIKVPTVQAFAYNMN